MKNGYLVKCITSECLVKFHMGYKLDENDYRDVKAVCKRFGIEMPDEYAEFVGKAPDNPLPENLIRKR